MYSKQRPTDFCLYRTLVNLLCFARSLKDICCVASCKNHLSLRSKIFPAALLFLYLSCSIKLCNYSIYLNALAAAVDILQISAFDLALSSPSLCISTVVLIPSMFCSCLSYRFFLFIAANATNEANLLCPLFVQNILKQECPPPFHRVPSDSVTLFNSNWVQLG